MQAVKHSRQLKDLRLRNIRGSVAGGRKQVLVCFPSKVNIASLSSIILSDDKTLWEGVVCLLCT